jgi:hypothetical protein
LDAVASVPASGRSRSIRWAVSVGPGRLARRRSDD